MRLTKCTCCWSHFRTKEGRFLEDPFCERHGEPLPADLLALLSAPPSDA